MNKFNEKFDKIFVISLKNNIERQQYIKSSLSKYNIDYEFFIVEKPNINILKEKYNLTFKSYNNINMGLLGCFDSHLKLWKQIIDNSLKNVIILEDDVIFNNNEEILQHIPKDYDIFYLGFEGGKNIPINNYIGYPTRPACTHAYAISIKGAELLYYYGLITIKRNNGIQETAVDGFTGCFPHGAPHCNFNINRKYKKYAALNNLMKQNISFKSDIN
jgi:GR25 family glycosyltransferase involved in LPS biosynthesis